MSENGRLAVDTGVLITLAAATGSWEVLDALEIPVAISSVVLAELRRGSPGSPGVGTPLSKCMEVWPHEVTIPVWLSSVLDKGEASIIALAMEHGWAEVAIDEAVGRSVARTCGFRLTGSLGILIRAKRKGYQLPLAEAITRIRGAGIWLGKEVENAALRAAGEFPPTK